MLKNRVAVSMLSVALTAAALCMPAMAEGTVNEKEEIKVGFIQLVDMADATQMRESFQARLDEEGYGDKIVADYQDAAGDVNTMASALQKFVDNEVDLIVPMLTPPTQAAVSMDSGIPIIFMSVVDPVYSKRFRRI